MSKKNPRVFFDVTADGKELGRIEFDLRADKVPKTAENFRVLCTGEKGYGYKGTIFREIIPGFMCHGGDWETKDGYSSTSIYGGTFEDENFELKHTGPGILAMAHSGPNSNGSQFFISTIKTDWLNDRHVVFGSVVKGMEVVNKIEGYGTYSGVPSKRIEIVKCGELKDKK